MSSQESVLPGKGRNDYEKYLSIPDLLACQKSAGDLVHHDEMMFQIVHQVAELWMKLEIHELSAARSLIEKEDCLGAMSLLQRVHQIQRLVTQQIHLLETMSPWDYQTIRLILGKGSGLESPGFATLLTLGPTLWPPFEALVKKKNLELIEVFTRKEEHLPLFLLAEGLMGFDENFQLWRFHHLKLVEREIGGKVTSLKGRAIDFLSENLAQRFFPELWEVRNTLTRRAGTSY
jgi:tryptophan 2,3-dioxygenase